MHAERLARLRQPDRRSQPIRHIGWVFPGRAAFEGRTLSFLAQGAESGERLIYVADDPYVNQWPKRLLERGALQVLSTSEVYGPEHIVDAATQRATFEAELSEALRDGYTGLRVAADNTSLIAGPERLAAWMRWEDEAERFMAQNPVTGLCAFDRSRAESDCLHMAMGVHRAVVPPSPDLNL